MEQKKTLWIIAASGVFLLVVIGAALLLNAPSTNAPATASITTIDKTPEQPAPVVTTVQTPAPEIALDSNTLAFQKIEEGSAAPQAPVATESTINAENAALTINTTTTNIELKTSATQSPNVTATSRAGQEALANAAAAKPEPATIYTAAPGTAKPVVQAPAPSAAPARSNAPAKPAKAVAAKPAAPKPAPVATKYWVQAASYTNKKSADSARSALDDNKIPAEVFTYKDNKDTMFYRVRVGPYTTKSEAEYWKTRICKIDLFKDTQSYVTAVKM